MANSNNFEPKIVIEKKVEKPKVEAKKVGKAGPRTVKN